MKKSIQVLISMFALLLHVSIPLMAQDPDGWEAYQTSLQPPEIVLPAIELKEGMVVGEIGAGRGRYTVILARHVGEKGHIYANDIDTGSLDYLDLRLKRDKIDNITIIRGKERDPLLPENKLDMIFIVNTYHHISHPVDVLKNAYPALKTTGTLVIIDGVPGKYGGDSSHTIPKDKLISQSKEAGFSFVKVAAELERDNIYIFRK
ncbi:MAG: methyltransferase domain-containing protein [Bacteroidia bacterium]|nr:MAG: methyltransferase domain-containing protein [Bacteroidia bacterium]